jgi:hypothetical protein
MADVVDHIRNLSRYSANELRSTHEIDHAYGKIYKVEFSFQASEGKFKYPKILISMPIRCDRRKYRAFERLQIFPCLPHSENPSIILAKNKRKYGLVEDHATTALESA